MTILYGTGNPAKLEAMRHRLAGLDMEIIGLRDVRGFLRERRKDSGFGEAEVVFPQISEDGTTPLENARRKAAAYYRAFGIPVFSCDTGLYFDNVEEADQPGVFVRRSVDGREMTDEEMQEYYGALARKYGGTLTAQYRNGICLVLDETHIYEAMEQSMASDKFLLTDKPHPIRHKGFPLDAMSIDPKTGKYFYDLDEGDVEKVAVKDGFLDFFAEVMGRIKEQGWSFAKTTG